MKETLVLAADMVAITTLVCGVYYRRHRGRDMVLPFIGLNVAVLVVCMVLAGVTVGIGVGLGLFGVLAIIRLRSSEISHSEVAYYFASLALGLICGLHPDPAWLAPALSAVLVGAFAIVDQPTWHAAHRHQEVTVDAVYPTEEGLKLRLEEILTARIERMTILRTDLVRDQTVVDVRYRLLAASPVAGPGTATGTLTAPARTVEPARATMTNHSPVAR